ncbi:MULTISPECIES: hypothetical protein [Janthinobacterium]|uniref:hypothetical protein n=1 Tax=Janthinobacterium TaxID=29580 RepID=UPI001C5B94F9|nr:MULTISPECIES: hypothetical protein [Janthinobacterium]MBW3509611.1 hypothetical protein [Janthinobacterium sp. NKUCC06_STL]MCA1859731.1 hypothetical protein [Janthinobacterium lividum]
MPTQFSRHVFGCAILAFSALASAQAASPQHIGPIDARAVWQERSLSACRSEQSSTAPDVCLLRTMQRSGARPQAIAAARMLVKANNAGFISAWRPLGKAALATVTYPFRANTNEGTLLIGSDGAAIDVDEGSVSEEDRATPAWRAFAAAHPDAVPFAPADFVGSTATSDGGQSVLFSTPLITCHACAEDGALLVAYTIDKAGIVRERKLLTIK